MKAIKRWWKRFWCKDPHLTDNVLRSYPENCQASELYIVLRPDCKFVRNNPTFPTRWRVLGHSSMDADGYGNNVYTLKLMTTDGKLHTVLQTSRAHWLEDESKWLTFKDILLDLPDPE